MSAAEIESTDRLIPVREAAELVALSKSTVYEQIKSGEFPGVVTIGKHKRIHLATLLAAIKSQLGDAA